jgi:hypothetical protein
MHGRAIVHAPVSARMPMHGVGVPACFIPCVGVSVFLSLSVCLCVCTFLDIALEYVHGSASGRLVS